MAKLEEGGDFLVVDACGHSWACERKTADDFIASLAKSDEYPEGRLRNQLRRMAEAYDSSCIVLEGPILRDASTGRVLTSGRGRGGWTHASVMAILYDLQLRYTAPVMPTGTLDGTLNFIRVMHNRGMRGCILNGGRKVDVAR